MSSAIRLRLSQQHSLTKKECSGQSDTFWWKFWQTGNKYFCQITSDSEVKENLFFPQGMRKELVKSVCYQHSFSFLCAKDLSAWPLRRRGGNLKMNSKTFMLLTSLLPFTLIVSISGHIKFRIKLIQTSWQKVIFQLKFEVCWQIFFFWKENMSNGWIFLIVKSAVTFRIILYSFKAVTNIYSNYMLTVLTTVMHYL